MQDRCIKPGAPFQTGFFSFFLLFSGFQQKFKSWQNVRGKFLRFRDHFLGTKFRNLLWNKDIRWGKFSLEVPQISLGTKFQGVKSKMAVKTTKSRLFLGIFKYLDSFGRELGSILQGGSKKASYFVFHPKVLIYNFSSIVFRWCRQVDSRPGRFFWYQYGSNWTLY